MVAALDSAAEALGLAPGPRRMEGRLTASVPIEVSLALEGRPSDGTVSVGLLDGGQTLATGSVRALGPAETDEVAPWTGGARGWRLPMSDECLACGAANPLGLQVALAFDDEGVWTRFRARAPWRTPAGTLHPAAAPVILDEVAWWLGALVMREGGLTNRISLALYRQEIPFDEELVAAGRFDQARPVDRRQTFWRVACALRAGRGNLLASASVVFRGGAEYSERQMAYFRARTPADVFRRMFPGQVE